jgi:hypothetical protein
VHGSPHPTRPKPTMILERNAYPINAKIEYSTCKTFKVREGREFRESVCAFICASITPALRRSPMTYWARSSKALYTTAVSTFLVPTLICRLIILDSSSVVISPMSQMASTSTTSLRFQAIFNAALKSYEKQTKKDLLVHPLAAQLQSCNSTSAIRALLQDQVREFDQVHSGDERLTKWLSPTVNVLCAFSAAISGGVSLVCRLLS